MSATAKEVSAKPPTRRALAKLQTRERVLAAARKLFTEQGFEGATVRDIAAAAGMSTGAVFANFTDKTDLFRDIMRSAMDEQLEAMRAGIKGIAAVEDALAAYFSAGYAYQQRQLPLARAAFAVAWSPHEGPGLLGMPPALAMQALIADLLLAGVKRGELKADCDIDLHAGMLFSCYLSNFSHLILGSQDQVALDARARAQIRIILAGARTG